MNIPKIEFIYYILLDKETSAQARVSLYDFPPPEVNKSHILNRLIQ